MDKQVILDHFNGDFTSFYSKFLPELKPAGREFKALCPFHNDRAPSFSINRGTGLFKCFGCSADGDIFSFYSKFKNINGDFPAVLAGIAAEFGILNNGAPQLEKVSGTLGKIVKRYSYRGVDGEVLFTKNRHDPKDFRLCRPDGKDGYVLGMGGVEVVLYNLPAVLKADEVWIVEGEKDADNLIELGFTATTNFDGAGKWRDSYSQYLKDKNGVLIPDADDPGRSHMQKVAAALHGVAASVKILELPNPTCKGYDVSDFIAEQGDSEKAAERLSIMAESAAEWTPSTESKLEAKAPLVPEAEEKPATGGISSVEILHALGRGEDGDAELFIKLKRGGFCFDHADRRWYEFAGHFWKLDRTEKALAAISDVIDIYATEASRQAALKHSATVKAQKEAENRHAAIEREILKRIEKLHARQRKENVLTLAAAGDGSLGITGEEWDADAWVIGCPNGVVCLKTGELRQGKPDDYIKTVANTEWAGIGTPCPAWERFLSEVFDGDTEIITYIQTLLGYGLIGDTPLHIIPILWGRGRNGKGTLLEIVKHILGP